MGKLKALGSALTTLAPPIARQTDAHGHSARAEPWRAWYFTKAWRRLRWAVLLRDLFTCQMAGCGRIVSDTSKLVADHKIPHRGDPTLFWDEKNLQCLCTWCHSSTKQAEERRGR